MSTDTQTMAHAFLTHVPSSELATAEALNDYAEAWARRYPDSGVCWMALAEAIDEEAGTRLLK